MSQADLMVLNIHLEVALMSVSHKCRIGKSLWKLGIYGLLTSRFGLEHVCKQVVLEYPVPMQMLSYRSTSFIGSYDRRCFQPLAYFLICTVCLAAILFEYVLHCTLTYILAGQVGYKFCNPFERNTLHYIKVCHQCTEVVTILDTTVGSFAVVYATAFTDLLVILFLAGLYDHLDINNLCLTDLLAWYINQEPTTAFTIDGVVLYNYVWFCYSLQCVTLVARLSTARLSAWLAKRLCPAQLTGSDTFLGWRVNHR